MIVFVSCLYVSVTFLHKFVDVFTHTFPKEVSFDDAIHLTVLAWPCILCKFISILEVLNVSLYNISSCVTNLLCTVGRCNE